MKVILFDIDNTLINTRSGSNGMEMAFREVFGISDGFKGIVMAGKPDPSILLEALIKHNLQNDDNKINVYKKRYFQFLAENIRHDVAGEKVLPGVRKLLDELDKNKNIKIGLLTGNWKKGAYIKLKYFGLDNYFKFGAFGDDSANRDELLPFALKRCNSSGKLTAKDTVIVGDTPKDIRCAKVHCAKVIAVATGRYSVDELSKEGADLVLKDLTDVGQIISWIEK
jgi:phosphoglycolate phosphatase